MNVKDYVVMGITLGVLVSLGFLVVSNFNNKPTTRVVNVSTQLLEKTKEDVKLDATVKKIGVLSVDAERVVPLLGEIGDNAAGVAARITELSTSSKPIILAINSPGGSVLDGALIISAMEASKAPVYTVCVQLCASMAAIIHQYGVVRLMQDRSILMFHDAAGQMQGFLPHMTAQLNVINRYIARFNVHISNRIGITPDALEALEHKNLCVDAQDSLPMHLTDNLVYLRVTGSQSEMVMKTLNTKQRSIRSNFPSFWF